jgi:hypothetical protein
MKKFLKLLLLFFIPIIIGMISFEFLLRAIPNDYSYKKQYLDKNAKEIEVLYLGNSHIFYGINPEFSNFNSFNAAYGSQSLNYDFAILNKYKNQWKKLKFIIIPVDYTSMYSSIEDGIEKWRVKNYALYFDIKSFEISNNFEILNGKLLKNIVRIKSFYLNKRSDISCNKLGYGTAFNSKNAKNLEETGKEAALNHTKKIENNVSFPKNEKALKSIIELAQQKNIKVIFITSPAYKTYTDRLKPQQLKNTISHVKTLVSKNKHTYYLDLLDDPRFETRDFFDADHLNEIGSKKFTLIMDSIVNEL